jgi:hypothetical protein
MTSDPLLEILETVSLRRQRKQRLVNLLGGMPADPSDGDPVVLGIPLQNRPGNQTQTLANFSGDRDLPLPCEP